MSGTPLFLLGQYLYHNVYFSKASNNIENTKSCLQERVDESSSEMFFKPTQESYDVAICR